MKLFGRLSIFTKIFWTFSSISSIVMVIVAVISYHQFAQSLSLAIQNKLIAISDGRQNLLGGTFDGIDRFITEIASDPTPVAAFERFDSAFKEFGVGSREHDLINSEYGPVFQRYFDANDYLYDMLFISSEGNIIFSMKHEKDFGKNLNDPILKNTVLTETVNSANAFLSTRISDFDLYPPSNRPALFITHPVFSKNKLLGMIAFQINPEIMYKFAQNYVGLPSTGDIIFAKRFGDEIVFTTPTRFKADMAFTRGAKFGSGNTLAMQRAINGETGIGIVKDYRGITVLARWQYIPLLRWGMVVKVDLAEAFRPVYQLRNLYVIIFIITIMILLVVSFMAARAIATPINIIRSGLNIIGSGNLGHKIALNRSDEIGELVDNFNKMAGDLKKSNEKLLRSEKLAVVGQLASSVAHELRNPLSVMKNAVYYLNMLGTGKDNPDIKENLAIISDEIEGSDKVIRDLLEFSHIKKPALNPEDINLIIRETLNRVKVPANIKLVTELGENLPRIQADALQIRQVFYNLVYNAIQAMEKGGTLTISSCVMNDVYIAVTIKDTGCGIPAENLQKIFDPLFSTKTKGTGLGLSVVASLVEGHGGRIEMNSEVGKGSAFTVNLPIRGGGVRNVE